MIGISRKLFRQKWNADFGFADAGLKNPESRIPNPESFLRKQK